MIFKLGFSLCLIIVNFSIAFSQDTIRLNNGVVLSGRITEVNAKEIKFRVDSGSVKLDKVVSYKKDGKTVINKTNNQADCERKNVGDMEFINKTANPVKVNIYAIAVPPASTSARENDNPLVAEITIPPHSAKTAFELTAGVHFIKYDYSGPTRATGIRDGTGQIKITKCETGIFELK